MPALLRDGVPFTLGRLVVFEDGREVQTNTEEFEVEVLLGFGQRLHYVLRRKGGCAEIDLSLLYSSQSSRIGSKLETLSAQKRAIDQQINALLDELTAYQEKADAKTRTL